MMESHRVGGETCKECDAMKRYGMMVIGMLAGLWMGTQAWATAEGESAGSGKKESQAVATTQPGGAETAAKAVGEKAEEGEKGLKKTEKGKRSGNIGVYYLTVMKELGLEGKVKEDFIEKVRARQAALQQWEVDHKTQMTMLEKAEAQAKAENNPTALNEAEEAIRTLKADRKKVEDAASVEIRTVLTETQRAHWECLDLYAGQLRRLGKVKDLTEEQKGKIKAICVGKVEEVKKLKAGDVKGEERIKQEIMKEVGEKVLTPVQAAGLPGYEEKKEPVKKAKKKVKQEKKEENTKE